MELLVIPVIESITILLEGLKALNIADIVLIHFIIIKSKQ